MKNIFESQPSRVALRYEKRAKEGAALKNKKASEAAKNAEVDKAKAVELLFQMIHRVYDPRRMALAASVENVIKLNFRKCFADNAPSFSSDLNDT